jgi:hypothetical protein
MPKPVVARDNGHSAKTYGNPVDVKCSACGSREVALWLFAKRAEGGEWANVEKAAGPSF